MLIVVFSLNNILRKEMADKNPTILDHYFRRPLLYDYVISSLVLGTLFFLYQKRIILIPKAAASAEFSSDIATLGLTISGFILTLITILISFKSNQLSNEEKLTNNSSPFKIFLASIHYKTSIGILKNGVISLIVVSFTIYLALISLQAEQLICLFFFNILGLLIILATFFRCFYILDLVLKMQS